jgi:hypothetical protein
MSGKDFEDWASKGVPNSIMLSKPFAPAQLITAVSQLLNARHIARVRPPQLAASFISSGAGNSSRAFALIP